MCNCKSIVLESTYLKVRKNYTKKSTKHYFKTQKSTCGNRNPSTVQGLGILALLVCNNFTDFQWFKEVSISLTVGQKVNRVKRVFALHVVDLDLIFGIPYASLTLPKKISNWRSRKNPKHCRLWPKKNLKW